MFTFTTASLGLETFPLPNQAFSTLVESEQRLAVERTLTLGGGMGAGYGSHAERAVSGPAATWYVAEGATRGTFDLFYLLQNPVPTTATATITYLLPSPRAPIVRAYTLLPNSLRTIYLDQEPGLDATDVSARTEALRPAGRRLHRSAAGHRDLPAHRQSGRRRGQRRHRLEVGGDLPDTMFPTRKACHATVPVPARGRYITGLKALCPALGDDVTFAQRVAGTITSDGPPIVVERSTY